MWQNIPPRNYSGGSSQSQRAGQSRCGKCGTQHQRYRCPVYGKICHKCKRYNQFPSLCKSFNVNSICNDENLADELGEQSLSESNSQINEYVFGSVEIITIQENWDEILKIIDCNKLVNTLTATMR